MARQIKNISTFPEHSISMVLKKIGKEQQIREVLLSAERELKKGEVEKKESIKVHITTDQEIFDQKIVPQMMSELSKIGHKDLMIKFDLDFPENPMGLDIEDLGMLYRRVDVDKKTCAVVGLYLSYYQGLIYITLRGRCGTQEEFVQMLSEKFETTYSTAQQYIVVTLLIKRYPRLLFVGLTHSQLRKHRTRLENFLSENGNFEAPAVIKFGIKTVVTVTPSTVDFGNLKVRPAIDPDADLKPEMEHIVIFDDMFNVPEKIQKLANHLSA